ncbi:hypothetical protein C5C31_08870 [Rathayibacter rathayi]|uniref:Condensation domain-containing protein n=1 Tax=Rathayibacter rathayi TaxID=33887 RepID=A0ABD6W4Y8_RATRA|nr:hypothetical protein [Rathayibacter rathayi]PPF09936.1 hypothetical protein C5C04_14080 [Rathayibacter rathayi]PPF74780.1 hypothetical protein C5C14_15300 [Rathayibacter rathayi]PPG09344.1 hypothetical protein C5C11_15355 [Rathayibacter rathayi]PPG36274.1 hypothetical protein C5C20_15460 [Rathayibacter rathayi]PPG64995.1 hypothetical protein C5C02_14250 [Rathayibacter rathayi]
MRAARDLGYDDLLISYHVGSLTGVTAERVRTALRDVLLSPRGAVLLRRRARVRAWRRIDVAAALDAAGRAVIVVDGPLEREDFVQRLVAANFAAGELPVRILFDGATVGFTLPHSLFDGTGATAIVALVIEKLGSPGADAVAPQPLATSALRELMERFELTGLAGVRKARDTFRTLTAATDTGYQLDETLSKQESERRTRLVSTVLGPDTLRAIAATPERARDGKRPARPPVSLKTASLVLRCLQDCGADGLDFRVVVPVDARRWITKGTEVAGNLSPSLPLGRLRADDWSATSLLERLSVTTKSGLPATWLLASALLGVKNLVRHPLAARLPPSGTPRVPWEIHVSLPSTEVTVSEELLPRIEPDTMISGIPAHLRFPLGVWVELAPMRDSMHLSIRDETGTFALDGFEERLLAAVGARAAEAS